MQATDVERRELLERRRGEINAANATARASIRDSDRHGPPVRTGYTDLASADWVPVEQLQCRIQGTWDACNTHVFGFGPLCIVVESSATMKSVATLLWPHEPTPGVYQVAVKGR